MLSILENECMFIVSKLELKTEIKPSLLKRNNSLSHCEVFFKIFDDDVWNLLEVLLFSVIMFNNNIDNC